MDDEHYGSQEAYLDALCAVLRVEYKAILDAGFMLQLDCPDIPMMASMMQQAQTEQMIDLVVQAINVATDTVPDGEVIMPRLIDTKYNGVEHHELVAQRNERYADLVGPENVLPGTDCGFGTFAGFGVFIQRSSG